MWVTPRWRQESGTRVGYPQVETGEGYVCYPQGETGEENVCEVPPGGDRSGVSVRVTPRWRQERGNVCELPSGGIQERVNAWYSR